MEAERQTSSRGFFQLFDWNSKSRKKLFSNKPEVAETALSKRGKQNVTKSLDYMQLMEAHDHIPSSVASDDGYRTKAPGVVAKLMGLDCLPTSALPEPSSTPFCDPTFSLNSCPQRGSYNFQFQYHDVNKSPSVNGPRNFSDLGLQKVQNRPIERFQSETLPSKPAKPIPIADKHRLLSPIKNPGFVPTKDLAYIVEASSKIMEQFPQFATKGKTLHLASSSTPLRIHDRERMEVVERDYPLTEVRGPKVPVVSQNNGGPSRKKNYKGSNSERETSGRLMDKGKSVSLAVQAKVSVQRNEQLYSNDSRRSANRKEADMAKNGQHNQKSVQKRNSTSRTSGVLKQNSQKQNCISTKFPPRASLPTHQNRKSQSVNKNSSKVHSSAAGLRKIHTMPKDTGKEIMQSKTKRISEKKPTTCENLYFEDPVGENIMTHKDHNRQIKCNVTRDSCSSWDTGDRKNSIDVVSFTFTSPIKKTQNVTLCEDISCSPKNPNLYSSPFSNVTGGDALSVLLDQKLKELTSRVESSHFDFENVGSATSSFNAVDNSPKEECIDFEINLRKARSSSCDADCDSHHDRMLKANGKWKGLREIEEQNSFNRNDGRGKECDLQFASFMETLEPSSSDGSYCLSYPISKSITKGNKQYHLIEPQDMNTCISIGMSQSSGADYDFSDSASSSSVACMSENCNSPFINSIDFKRSPNWELEYIAKILFSSDLILDDLVLGQVNKVLNLNLFDLLENSQIVSTENEEEYLKLERKVLFDCVVECLDLRGEQLIGGNFKAFSKWGILFRRKILLANDLCKEVSSWTGLEDLMVDELVDKDMSFGKGKWVDFEIEESEEGVEIEKAILSSLMDELVESLW